MEMPILKDVATVAFCDAQSTQEIHEKVSSLLGFALCCEVPAFLVHRRNKLVHRAPHDAQNARHSRTRTQFHSLESCFVRGLHPLKLQPGGGFTL